MKFMINLISGLFLVATLIACVTAKPDSSMNEDKEFQTRMLELKQQLGLTEEQANQMSSILKTSTRRVNAILEKYNISMENQQKTKLSFAKKMSLREDITLARSKLESDLADILSEQQISSWKELNKAAQQKFRRKLRNKIT